MNALIFLLMLAVAAAEFTKDGKLVSFALWCLFSVFCFGSPIAYASQLLRLWQKFNRDKFSLSRHKKLLLRINEVFLIISTLVYGLVCIIALVNLLSTYGSESQQESDTASRLGMLVGQLLFLTLLPSIFIIDIILLIKGPRFRKNTAPTELDDFMSTIES